MEVEAAVQAESDSELMEVMEAIEEAIDEGADLDYYNKGPPADTVHDAEEPYRRRAALSTSFPVRRRKSYYCRSSDDFKQILRDSQNWADNRSSGWSHLRRESKVVCSAVCVGILATDGAHADAEATLNVFTAFLALHPKIHAREITLRLEAHSSPFRIRDERAGP